jgi:hypothetical protein
VERVVARVRAYRLVRGILAETAEAEPLQVRLHPADVAVGDRARAKMRVGRREQRAQQHLGVQHLVISERAGELGLAFEREQGVADIAR